MGHRDSWQIFPGKKIFHFIRKIKQKVVFGITLVLSSVLISVNANAEAVPRLSISEYYNDNVALAPEGLEQDAYITELKPGITIDHDGRRIDLRLDYLMQALYFSSDRDKREIYHNASAQTNVVLVPQAAYLDASAAFSQQFISPDGAIDLDNLSTSRESTDITTYSISPYMQQHYGNIINAEYRISQESVSYTNNTSVVQTDSTSTVYSANFTNGLAFDELQWRLFLSRNEFVADNAEDSVLQNVLVETSYRLSAKFELLANVGYEDNDFQQANLTEDPSGEYWNGGIGWNPSRQTHFRATVGERFFGRTKSLLVNHRTRHSIWNIEYNEEITTTPQLQILYAPSTPETEAEDPVLPADPSNLLLVRSASVILLERWSFGLNYQKSKTTLNVSAYDESRNYQDLGQEEQTRGLVTSWQWRFKPRMTLQLSGSRYRLKNLTTSLVDYIGQGELSLERRIKRRVTGAIGFSVTDRNSSNNSTEYQRKLFFVSVNMEF